MRDQGAPRSRAADLCLGLGGVLLLAYALPLFAPPAALPVALPPPGATAMARMFPHVPAWWMTARLVALLIGAVLVAAVTKRSVLPVRRPGRGPAARGGEPRFATAALAAAVRACRLPALDRAASAARSAALRRLAGGARWPPRARGSPPAPAGRAAGSRWMVGAVLVLIIGWAIMRLWIGWHSPRAANVVDMWRTFAALVRMTTARENLLSNSIDPEIPGVNSTPLFFQGLPILQMLSHAPA